MDLNLRQGGLGEGFPPWFRGTAPDFIGGVIGAEPLERAIAREYGSNPASPTNPAIGGKPVVKS
ncbi:MAG: hypothetical protein QMD08_06780 [Actinomycetota bacterium]|nr:hypothetical protein [Actinomycetota bacterium]